MNIAALETSALHLAPQERASLAHKLLLSLDEQSERDIEQAWHAEAQRRAQQILSESASTVSAEEANKIARSLLK